MKKLVLLALLVSATSSLAYADNRCGGTQGVSCNGFYNRFDALKVLLEVENSTQDAEQNLAIVEAAQKRYNLNLRYVVDNFVHLQQALGGGGATADTRKAFNLILQALRGPRTLDMLVTSYIELLRAENSKEDAALNFILVAEKVSSSPASFSQANRFFTSLLLLLGNNHTNYARDVFSRAMFVSKTYSLTDLHSSFKMLLNTENSIEDSIGNFDLVLRGADRCGDLTKATLDFLQVLQQYSNSQTKEARNMFIRLYEI
ncbi:hypothetical protein ACLWBD_13690 [Bdellovibrio sp. HCB117]|uniref:hypothetical protein n=1 Tax=Bdellovibrio sp. HCB117 TaxID=3394359 RepID=UPI0039B5AE7E